MILSYIPTVSGKQKDVDEELLGFFFLFFCGGEVYVVRKMRMPGCWGKVMVSSNESQGWRKRGYNFQNARFLTLHAALLFPSLSMYFTLLKDKFSLLNNTQLGPKRDS